MSLPKVCSFERPCRLAVLMVTRYLDTHHAFEVDMFGAGQQPGPDCP
jgi:hypothetical protein